jgi:hypothetical protein
MNPRVLSVALVASIFALLTIVVNTQIVVAGEIGQAASVTNKAPEVFLLKKAFDICENDGLGGSQPDGTNLQDDGCIGLYWANPDELGRRVRYNQYAFTGEQIIELVAVRDLNGALDILSAHGTVDGADEVKCNDVTSDFSEGNGTQNCNIGQLSIPVDFSQIPAKGPAPQGLEKDYDKVYECILTVEPQWSGIKRVTINAVDQSGADSSATSTGIAQDWFFNPAIVVDLATNDGSPKIKYEPGDAGQTVYSTNKLVVTNLSEGGVDLWVFIAATDLTDPHSFAAKCPVSNVLDVDVPGPMAGMEYRCKIGNQFDNNWNDITNKVNTAGCTASSCYNARPIITQAYPILFNQHSAECQFRLTYPVPCVGNFSQGKIIVIVKAL